MTHLVGIDKGPVMDWTNDMGLGERYRKWKKCVEVLFKGPLNAVAEGVKCNYIIYWSGDHGMELVDKWTAEGKINDGNKEQQKHILDSIWKLHTPSNQPLIAVVELKWLFQGSLSLEDFHTKALKLVQQAGYEGDARDRVLRDTIISGLTSDKIRAKIVKEGHGVNLNRVMEIARLEVSMQQHLDRMQETAKVNYVKYGKLTKFKKKKPQSSAGATSQGAGGYKGAGGHRGSRPGGKPNKRPPLPPDNLLQMWKGGNTKRHRTARLWMPLAEGVEKKGHYEKVCLQGKHSAHSLETPEANSAGGWGQWTPIVSMMRDSQSTLTWSVSPMRTNIWSSFQLHWNLQPWGERALMQILLHLHHPLCCSRQDTGADVNLMNRKNIQPTLWRQPSIETYTHQDGKLWEFCSESVRNVPCFSQVERQGLQTIVLHHRLWQIPQLAVKGCLLHSGSSQTLLHSGEDCLGMTARLSLAHAHATARPLHVRAHYT